MEGNVGVGNTTRTRVGDAVRASAYLRSKANGEDNHGDPNGSTNGHFRFYDNRQSYNQFVQGTGEKSALAQRIIQELSRISSVGKCLRIFDAGVGDGTVLTEVMEGMHDRFPKIAHYVVGKEISTEDVRAVMQKLPQRLAEHPDSVIVLTNRPYDQAPKLSGGSQSARNKIQWHEAALEGTNTHQLKASIQKLGGLVDDGWRTKPSADGKFIVPEKPFVLVLYRKDRERALRPFIPDINKPKADYHGIIGAQPFALDAEAEFKARKVIAPLARALAQGGRLLLFHSKGGDHAHEIVDGVWPGDNPFKHTGQDLLDAVERVFTDEERQKYELKTHDDLPYPLHKLGDNAAHIGTSPLLSLWAIATYIAQVKDSKIRAAVRGGKFLESVERVYKKHTGNLWFHDHAYSITRKLEQNTVRARLGAAFQRARQKVIAALTG